MSLEPLALETADGYVRVLGTTHAPLDLGALTSAIADARSGAIASFLGTVRSPNEGRRVDGIDYEGYEGMIASELVRIADDLHARHGVLGLALVHRLGPCLPGEASIAIVACSAHRDAAFDACREGLNECKARLPVWKHEHDEEGPRWVEGQVVDRSAL